jgi:hypothetical protein
MSHLSNILNLIAAVGGLGAAAMGLVDASKAFWGGPSNFGFRYIRAAVERFVPAPPMGRVHSAAPISCKH